MSDENSDATYTIGAAARLTGLTTHTLRSWERRYSAVVAERGSNGHRYYRTEDVEKLSLLRALTERGRAISSIASLNIEELRDQVREYREMQMVAAPEELTVGIYGSVISSLFPVGDSWPGVIRIAVSDTSPTRFRADIRQLQPDVLVVETSTVTGMTIKRIKGLARIGRCNNVVVVYGYGNSADINSLVTAGINVVRSPATRDEVLNAITAGRKSDRKEAVHGGEEDSDEFNLNPTVGTIPVRQFTTEQLVKLSQMPNEILCECPRHLSDLVTMLTTFEIYSQECESRSEEDAALHASLHITTSRARALMEAALADVIESEGIKV